MSPDETLLIRRCAEAARAAARRMAATDAATREALLEAVARELEAGREAILAANARDLEAGRAAGLGAAMLDRLALDPVRLEALIAAVRAVNALPDPLGEVAWERTRPDGLRIGRLRAPLGAIAMVYESRPNVTVDAAVLCLKAGNACVLRGGSEARHSNAALLACVQAALEGLGLPPEAASGVPVPGREAVAELLRHDDCLDLVIPRGGEGLIRQVAAVSRVPVIRHYKGVCHLFVERSADPEAALRLLIDGKCARPSACNALETLLVDAPIAASFLSRAAAALAARGVRLRACPAALPLLPGAEPASAEDWDREYLDLVLSVRVVESFDAALAHIARHGSLHTEAIATRDPGLAARFRREVDASAVMVNASTRFNDGGELGLGAEIGISTTKLHAYGPMGLEALTTRKWVVEGEGHTRTPVAT
ncbi:glutamate-5-semialdehyde dehydrogenase [Silanimonas lenta]|uniref:glutamate-5-semialdehyde dehydrogenase n=1 Tax=Silanimonas lenta TaxID=265429 RepID=UPI0003FDCA9F|nr:glutamate-5-semialdehyde dehydrogenase [Silanimonas lenta]